MKKTFFLLGYLLIVLGIAPSTIFAASGDKGPATVYKVTITKFEISEDGTNWITLFNGTSSTLDIASVDAGASVGNFLSGLSVPDGNYTQVKVTVSNSFTIKGNVGTLYTLSTKTSGVCDSTTTAGNVAECVVSLADSGNDLPAPTPDTLPTTLVVKNGAPSHKIRVSFDVSTSIQEGSSSKLLPAPPTVTMTMIAL